MSIRRTAPRLRLSGLPQGGMEGAFWGNGTLGALLYAKGSALHFTIDHTYLWELRDTGAQAPKATYAQFLKNKEAYRRGDAALVETTDLRQNGIGRTRLPGLGLEIRLPYEITSLETDTRLDVAVTRLCVNGALRGEIYLDSLADVLSVRLFGEGADRAEVTLLSWDTALPELSALAGWQYPPAIHEQVKNGARMRQTFSAGSLATLAADWRRDADGLCVLATLRVGEDGADALLADYFNEQDARYARHCEDWLRYTNTLSVDLPDESIQSAFDAERYKLYCNEREHARPITLQGVWNLDTRMPPWYGDLHNDLNVQACYWPAFKTGSGRLAAAYVDTYCAAAPRFEARAKALFGIEGALHIPLMMTPDGSGAASEWCFWNTLLGPELFVGTDFVAYYEYTRDEERLREKIYPFLQRIVRLYEALRVAGNDGLWHLPLTNSPELFRDGGMLMGEDSTFFLSALHHILRHMAGYAALLGFSEDAERFSAFDRRLAPCPVGDEGYLIMTGVPPYESHRHFCHLYPVFPLAEHGCDTLADRSLDTAINLGLTEGAAFTFPYLAIFAARCARGNMARTMLRLYCDTCRSKNTFTVNGDPYQNGVLKAQEAVAGEASDAFTLESGLMLPAAVCDMLAHRSGDTLHVLAGIPDDWTRCAFSGVTVEGGHRVGARMENGRVLEISILPGCDEELRLCVHPGHEQAPKRLALRFGQPVTLRLGAEAEAPALEQKEWLDRWIDDAEDTSTPRALLVGDSITRCCRFFVNEALGAAMRADSFTSSMALDHPAFADELKNFIAQSPRPYDIVHFNNGLHGWHLSPERYACLLDGLLGTLEALCPGARMIVATTTPVWQPGGVSAPDEKRQRVTDERNRLAVRLAREHRAEVNDLGAFMARHTECRATDGVHYTEIGARLLGAEVARILLG